MDERADYRLPLVLGDLTVRRLRPGDGPNVLAYLSDPAVAAGQYWDPFTPDQVAELFAEQAEVPLGTPGTPIVLAAEYGGRVIGDFPLTITFPEHRQGDVGFSFHQDYTGKGLATRALAAVLGFGFTQLGLHRITAATFTDNDRACRLMERVGMRREAHLIHDGFVRGRWVDVYCYGILDEEWHARHSDLVATVSP